MLLKHTFQLEIQKEQRFVRKFMAPVQHGIYATCDGGQSVVHELVHLLLVSGCLQALHVSTTLFWASQHHRVSGDSNVRSSTNLVLHVRELLTASRLIKCQGRIEGDKALKYGSSVEIALAFNTYGA